MTTIILLPLALQAFDKYIFNTGHNGRDVIAVLRAWETFRTERTDEEVNEIQPLIKTLKRLNTKEPSRIIQSLAEDWNTSIIRIYHSFSDVIGSRISLRKIRAIMTQSPMTIEALQDKLKGQREDRMKSSIRRVKSAGSTIEPYDVESLYLKANNKSRDPTPKSYKRRRVTYEGLASDTREVEDEDDSNINAENISGSEERDTPSIARTSTSPSTKTRSTMMLRTPRGIQAGEQHTNQATPRSTLVIPQSNVSQAAKLIRDGKMLSDIAILESLKGFKLSETSEIMDPILTAQPTTELYKTRIQPQERQNFIILPMYHSRQPAPDHWTVAIANIQDGRIHHYDSGDGLLDAETLQRIKNHLTLGKIALPKLNWTLAPANSAQQSNATDCGVFVAVNAILHVCGMHTASPIDTNTWRTILATMLQSPAAEESQTSALVLNTQTADPTDSLISILQQDKLNRSLHTSVSCILADFKQRQADVRMHFSELHPSYLREKYELVTKILAIPKESDGFLKHFPRLLDLESNLDRSLRELTVLCKETNRQLYDLGACANKVDRAVSVLEGVLENLDQQSRKWKAEAEKAEKWVEATLTKVHAVQELLKGNGGNE